jgi:hypothetical protein
MSLSNARIVLNPDDKNVPMRTRLLEQSNVARMEQVKTTRNENDALPVVFPFAALENQIVLRDYLRQFPAPFANPETNKKLILSCAASPLGNGS